MPTSHRGAVLVCLFLVAFPPAIAAQLTRGDSVAQGVEQLRQVIGDWSATTEFLREDGTAARTVEGTYTFRWVVPDRVIAGVSEIPALEQRSAILFYVNEVKGIIEMVSVGADGDLWVMTGPIAGETRTTLPRTMPDGTVLELRFTRSEVTPDSFRSRMEYRTAGGEWKPGNRQSFQRQG
jgi:hypothetical protein